MKSFLSSKDGEILNIKDEKIINIKDGKIWYDELKSKIP